MSHRYCEIFGVAKENFSQFETFIRLYHSTNVFEEKALDLCVGFFARACAYLAK
jgi:hypothetical protein